jgi:hypothetical protein
MNEVNYTSIRRGFDCGVTGFADFAMRLTRKGKWDCCRGRLRFANRPYTLIAPYRFPARGEGIVTQGEGATLPLLGAPSPWMLGCPTVFLSNPYQLWQTGSSTVKTASLGQGVGSQLAGPRSLPNSRSFSSASGWSA